MLGAFSFEHIQMPNAGCCPRLSRGSGQSGERAAARPPHTLSISMYLSITSVSVSLLTLSHFNAFTSVSSHTALAPSSYLGGCGAAHQNEPLSPSFEGSPEIVPNAEICARPNLKSFPSLPSSFEGSPEIVPNAEIFADPNLKSS